MRLGVLGMIIDVHEFCKCLVSQIVWLTAVGFELCIE